MTETGSAREKKTIREVFIQFTGKVLIREVNRNKGKILETVQIKPDGSLQVKDDQGRKTLFFANNALTYTRSNGPEALYQFAHQVQEKFPKLQFAFDQDKEGKSITYSVSLAEES